MLNSWAGLNIYRMLQQRRPDHALVHERNQEIVLVVGMAVIIGAAFLTALFCYLGLSNKADLPNGLTFFTGVLRGSGADPAPRRLPSRRPSREGTADSRRSPRWQGCLRARHHRHRRRRRCRASRGGSNLRRAAARRGRYPEGLRSVDPQVHPWNAHRSRRSCRRRVRRGFSRVLRSRTGSQRCFSAGSPSSSLRRASGNRPSSPRGGTPRHVPGTPPTRATTTCRRSRGA